MKLITSLICLTIVLSLSSQSISQEKFSNDSLTVPNNEIVIRERKFEPVFKDVIIKTRKFEPVFKERKLDSDSIRKVDWDLIGTGLLKGLEYKRLYQNEVLLTKVLKYEIDLWKEKSSNKDLVIDRLATELSKQPAYITTHDWKITTLITTLAVILTVFFMAEISE